MCPLASIKVVCPHAIQVARKKKLLDDVVPDQLPDALAGKATAVAAPEVRSPSQPGSGAPLKGVGFLVEIGEAAKLP